MSITFTTLSKSLLLLLFIFQVQFKDLKAQQPLNGFTCSFANLDGANVIACGSVVTATVNYPAEISSIILTFPNSFIITAVIGGNQSGNPTPSNGLMFQVFQPSGSAGTMVVTFSYRNCNNYPNSGDLNTTNLLFDCEGSIQNNPLQFTANIINPTDVAGLNIILNGQAAKADHSILPAIALSTTNQSQSAPPGIPVTRFFTVTLNSLSINSFDLSMVLENDVTINSFEITAAGQPNFQPFFTFGSTFNIFNLSNFPLHVVSNANGSRTITFEQNVILECAPPSPSIVNARIGCSCGTNQNNFFNANQITLDVIAETPPTINNITSSLLPVDNTEAPCSGNYEYSINFNITGTTVRLNQIQIPINTTSFQVQSVSIGTGSDFVSIDHTLDDSNLANSLITISALGNSTPHNQWPGFVDNFNGNPGAWFNVPTIGPSTLTLTIKVLLQYNCIATDNCTAEPLSISPQNNNQLVFDLTNTCLNDIEPSLSVNLPNIVAPTSSGTTVTGGCIPFNLNVPVESSAPFSYFINLPSQSSFQLNSGLATFFDCTDITYQASLSVGAPVGFNIGNITDLTINGQNAIAQNVGGNLFFDLPISSNPNATSYSYNINFILNDISCPVQFPETFGSFEYVFTVQAVCNDCVDNPCVKNLGCNTDILFVHCPGECDSKVGIDPGLTIHRSTFGWANPANYSGNPLSNLNFIVNDIDREIQLRKLYPYDLFQLTATGGVAPPNAGDGLHQHLSMELAFTDILGDNFFDYVGYQATFLNPTTNQTVNITNLDVPMEFLGANPQSVPGLPNQMLVRELRWLAADLLAADIDINNTAWTISNFEATFRNNSDAPIPIGNYEVDFLCQFRSVSTVTDINGEITNTTQHRSCDPYGASIVVLVPSVELVQQTVQTGDVLLPGDLDTNPAATITTNETCSFGHVIGIRHRGGLGDDVDDFPFEFRPLTAWPEQLYSSNIVNVDDLYDGFYEYSLNNPFTCTNYPNGLLPALEKGGITENYQGLVLKMEKVCATGAPIIPLSLLINQYAYIHNSHNIDPDSPLPNLEPEDIEAPAGLDCANLMNFGLTPTNFIQNDETTYNFSVSAPGGLGLPVVFRINLIQNLNDPPLPIEIGDLVFNETSLTPDNNGWYVFNNGLPSFINGTTNASILIKLLEDGCYAETFQIQFEWRIFCSNWQLSSFLSGQSGLEDCPSCTRTLNFRRSSTNLNNVVVTNGFTPAIEDCELVWALNLSNPSNQLPINMSNLDLNFTTGLIFQSASISINNCNVEGLESPSLQLPPEFELIQQQSPSITFIQTSLTTQSLFLPPGCTLTYSLRFKLSEDICENYQSGSSIIQASFDWRNVCDPEEFTRAINVSTTNLTSLISQLNNSSPACCVPLPEPIVQHVCGETLGSISFTNTFESIIEVTLLLPNGSSEIQTIQPSNVGTYLNLGIGTYGLVVSTADGAFFTLTTAIENHGFEVSIATPEPVCPGTTVTLNSTINPLISTSGTIYSYLWNTGQTTSSINVSPNTTTDYSLTVNNGIGSCSVDATTMVIIQPLPIIDISGNNPFCQGQSVTLNASAQEGTTFQWTNNSIVSPEITVSTAGPHTVTATLNGCSASASVSSIVHPLPDATIIAGSSTTFCQGGSVNLSVLNVDGNNYNWTLGGGNLENINTINVSTSGLYTVTVTNSTTPTCTNTSSQQVTVNPIPTVTIPTGYVLCAGGTPTLITAQSNMNNVVYNWNNTGNNTTPNYYTTQSNNTVVVTNINTSCTNSTSISLPTINLSQPISIVPEGDVNLCIGETVKLKAQPYNEAYTYIWNTALGTQFDESIIINQSQQVSLQIDVNSSYGCLFNATNVVDVSISPEHCPCICPIPMEPPVQYSFANDADLVSYFGSENIIGQCFELTSDLEINQTLNFVNCHIILSEGVQITVKMKGNLYASQNTVFEGCDKMWRGISNWGYVEMDGATIKDAQYGLVLERPIEYTAISVLNNVTFSNNFIGLTNGQHKGNHYLKKLDNCYFTGGPLKENYLGQYPFAKPQGGIAGIRIFNQFQLSINGSNLFEDLYNGIIVNNSSIRVRNTRFKNIGQTGLSYNFTASNDYNDIPNNNIINALATKSAGVNVFNQSKANVIGNFINDLNYKMFDGCKVGVSSERSWIRVEGCRFDGSETNPCEKGVQIKNSRLTNEIRVNNNVMRVNRIGIAIHNTRYNLTTEILNNAITLTGSFSSIQNEPTYFGEQHGILLNLSIYKFPQLESYSVEPSIRNNLVYLNSTYKSNGITIMSNQFVKVIENRVIRKVDSNGKGIFALNQGVSIISCNHSSGVHESYKNIDNSAFWFQAVNNSEIYGNISDSTLIGINIEDQSLNNNINLNRIKFHDNSPINTAIGLRLGNSCNIGLQLDKRNRFELPSTKAVNNSIYTNEFRVYHPTQSPVIHNIYYPVHTPFQSNCQQDNFFRCLAGSTNGYPNCNFIGSSNNPLNGAFDNTFSTADALAKDELEFDVYNETSIYNNKRKIYELLNDSLLVLPDTGSFLAFKQSLELSNHHSFNYIEKTRANLSETVPYIEMKMINDSIEYKVNELFQWESSHSNQWMEVDDILLNERLTIKEKIDFFENNKELLNESNRIEVVEKTNEIRNANSIIYPTIEVEQFEQIINEICLKTVDRDGAEFTFEDIAVVEYIAAQCPLKSGKAVYMARSLNFLWNDTISFNDTELCNAVGQVFRQAKPSTSTNYNGLHIYPIPSNGFLKIEPKNQTSTIINLSIYNLMGQKLMSFTANSNTVELDLNKFNLSSGIYTVQVTYENNKTENGRFLYEK